MINNDDKARWINGTMGVVKNLKRSMVEVEFDDGETYEITPFTWSMYKSVYDDKEGVIKKEEKGSFTQLPIRLAWAITVHKAQGKTFDKVIIDIGYGTFAHGQVYVALSRCTTLDGIILKKPIRKEHIFTDLKIVNFIAKNQGKSSDKKF